MRILGLAMLTGIMLATAPAQAQRFPHHRGPHIGIGLGFGYPPCGWGCAPYYGPGYYQPAPYARPYYGPSHYGPTRPAYDDGWREDRGQRNWRVTRRQGETDYELPESVLFALDSATISPAADTVLAEIAAAAKSQRGADLVVEGYTDTSGSREHNQALSDARARAVATALEDQGVARDRIRAEGMGETRLAVPTEDGVREPGNRRVVVRLMDAPRTARERDGDRRESPERY